VLDRGTLRIRIRANREIKEREAGESRLQKEPDWRFTPNERNCRKEKGDALFTYSYPVEEPDAPSGY
jgi:hypothetical protein